jgi:signal transduction histidine kinase/ActR/RegA family two-component response regulator
MYENDKINILLVDDQPGKLLSYEVILRDLGESLLTASSARAAFEHLVKHEIAVILIDVCMPELDGFELAAMIRSHPRFQTTAIIFVSAIALTDLDRVKGYEYGAVDYVPVPVVPELLRAKVRVFAELYRKTRQLELMNVELERRVAERTAELAQTNAELEHRVEERTLEREMALAQVHEMQKLESLGQLTGGLAHDFNNVLMAILGNLDLMARNLPDGAPGKSLVTAAILAAERGATLTKRMLAFARRQELQPESVSVPRLVNGMTEMLRRSLGPAIEIVTEFQDRLSFVRVDPNQLELALLNLGLNARDAMPSGGKLTIGARGERVGAGDVNNLAAGDYVRITVTDDGEGMDEPTLKRAAEPFFTTKGAGKGTGLGLSMVHGLTGQSGGLTRIASRRGLGTTVEMWLPVAESSEKHRPRPAPTAANGAWQPHVILLVDDDPMVAAGTAAMLEGLGHRVVVASSGAQALDVLEADDAPDLVITDHAMPGMTGTELARHIRRHWPNLPIILATGYAEVPSNGIADLQRLDKPFRLDKLAAAIVAARGQDASLDTVPPAA